MAKSTLEQSYYSSDVARSANRNVLPYTSKTNEIYYLLDLPTDELEPSETQQDVLLKKKDDSLSDVPAHPQSMVMHRTMEVPDVNVEIGDIIRAVVACNSEKDLEKVPMSATIKDLASSRSTLQNETIGDLEKEFGRLPELAEQLTLEQLGEVLKPTFNGKLGSKSKQLIEKMMAARMPVGFKETSAREHLNSRWSLANGRQDSVLLLATTMQPQVRLDSEAGAKTFLESVVTAYATQVNIDLARPAHTPLPNNKMTQSESKQLMALTKAQSLIMLEQLKSYATNLGIDLNAGDKVAAELRDELAKLRTELDVWTEEHGFEYGAGICSKFAADKARSYDSWWNWGLQDLWAAIQSLKSSLAAPDSDELDTMKRSAANRATPRMLAMVQCAGSGRTLPPLPGPDHTFLHALSGAIETGLQRAPTFRCTHTSLTPTIPLLTRLPASPTWTPNAPLTAVFTTVLHRATATGLTFTGKTALITGASPSSIAIHIAAALLAGGAHVLLTTSSALTPATTAFYQRLYAASGARGSRLVVVPFNQASARDVDALAAHALGTLRWDLDYVLPFAALPAGGGIDDLAGASDGGAGSKAELALRVSLTNALRLVGAVARQKARLAATVALNHPALALLPLSPNTGIFGGDGLYAEAKRGLEAALSRWANEGWGKGVALCGARIGWTRGTGLMAGNDGVAREVESGLGARTFGREEMGEYLVGLLADEVVAACQEEPVVCDLTGGLGKRWDLGRWLEGVRRERSEQSGLERAMTAERDIDVAVVAGEDAKMGPDLVTITPRPSLQLDFPALVEYDKLQPSVSQRLQGMVDLSRVPVIIGYSEIGPWGSARTRWDMEVNGQLSAGSCIELAWMTGLIKHFRGIVNGEEYGGWIDSKSNQPVLEKDMKTRYEADLLLRCGIRPVTEPDTSLHEVVVDRDLEPFEVSEQDAERFKAMNSIYVQVVPSADGVTYQVHVKKGAALTLPKRASTTTRVAGQIPTGWDPSVYGLPADLLAHLDPTAVYALIATADALLSAGVPDPYALYEHVHPSAIANCLGSGLGGLRSLRAIFRDRMLDAPSVAPDVLQESFVNTPAAWVNMLLLSASGPTRTPTGACATALESLDAGADLIAAGKAQLCVVGGVDDLGHETSAEFAHMRATVDADKETARGRAFAEMSRPAAATRAGFVEAHGAGVQVLASADLAVRLGLPIRGVVAWTGTANDGQGRSVPAPGKGLLAFARERRGGGVPSPMLDLRYRRSLLDMRLAVIQQSAEAEMAELLRLRDLWRKASSTETEAAAIGDNVAEMVEQERERIVRSAAQQRRDAVRACGNDFWKDEAENGAIAPIRGALAVWGLQADDLGVASCHGTSTVKGDDNELDVLDVQMHHLGRTMGNVLPCVFQKYLTGHPKAPAGAWMLNGCLQMLQHGVVPGNRNADNVDAAFERYESLLVLNRNVEIEHISAFSVASFGFGQKGAQAVGVHPEYVLAVLNEAEYNEYRVKAEARQLKACRRFQDSFVQNDLFVAKQEPPYPREHTVATLLDPSPPHHWTNLTPPVS